MSRNTQHAIGILESEFSVYTFLRDLELAALGNLDWLHGLVTATLGHILNLLDNVVAFEDFPKDNVLAIKPTGNDGGDEELTPVRVLS